MLHNGINTTTTTATTLLELGGSPVLTLFVSSHNATSERRFEKSSSILSVKEKLEPITGVPAGSMKLDVYDGNNQLIVSLSDDSKKLGYYPVQDYMTLKVTNTGPYKLDDYNDVSQVQKYEMPEEEYDKKKDSVRAFKRMHGIGRFATPKEQDTTAADEKEEQERVAAESISVGNRCIVRANEFERRGTVRFVGDVEFAKGVWVGIEYDEPVGKNNGSKDGVTYFEARPLHGGFVRPSKVVVGDFPEEDLFSDEEL